MRKDSGKLARVAKKKRWAALALLLAAKIIQIFLPQSGWRKEKKILILEPYGMGDIITLLPLIQNLHAAGYKVCLGTKPQWAPLLAQIPEIEVIDLTPSWTRYSSKEKYSGVFAFLAELQAKVKILRRLQASIALDPRGDARNIALLNLAGFTSVLTFDHYIGTNMRIPSWAATHVLPFKNIQRWALLLDFLPVLKIPPRKIAPSLECPRNLIPTTDIGLIPIAPWRGKYLPVDTWSSVTAHFQNLGYTMKVLCGPGQKPEASAQISDLPLEEVSTVQDWIHALARCRSIVTLDTGPMHLADALCIPQVALFGSTVLPLWAPTRPESTVLDHSEEIDGMPCHQIDKNLPLARKAMELISAEEIIAALSSHLNQIRSCE